MAASAKASISLASTRAAPACAAAIGDEAGAAGEIEHAPARDDLGLVEQMARQRLTARPGEGPERRRQAHFAEFLLGLAPQRHGLVGEMQPQLGRERRRAAGACFRG